MTRVLITGGSGFIGTNLVEHALQNGSDVINVDIAPPRNAAHREYWYNGDIVDRDSLSGVIREFSPDIVFHMAARTDLGGKVLADYAANTIGVQALIETLSGAPSVRRVVFASSRLVCRIGYTPRDERDYCPSTRYGESKVIGEQIARAAGTQLPYSWLIVRPTSIWGPWFHVPYKDFFLAIAQNKYVHPGSRQILKSFGFVGNTVYQLQRLIDAPDALVNGKTFYLADYPPIDVREMANSIQRQLGVPNIKTANLAALRAVAYLGDFLKALGWEQVPLSSFRLDNLLTPMVYDLAPLKAIVGELPYTVQEGIAITTDWLKRQGEIKAGITQESDPHHGEPAG